MHSYGQLLRKNSDTVCIARVDAIRLIDAKIKLDSCQSFVNKTMQNVTLLQQQNQNLKQLVAQSKANQNSQINNQKAQTKATAIISRGWKAKLIAQKIKLPFVAIASFLIGNKL